jgi:hypothetical protein
LASHVGRILRVNNEVSVWKQPLVLWAAENSRLRRRFLTSLAPWWARDRLSSILALGSPILHPHHAQRQATIQKWRRSIFAVSAADVQTSIKNYAQPIQISFYLL